MALNATIRLRAISKKDLNALLELAEQVAVRVTVDAFPTDEKPRFTEPASQLRVMVVRQSQAGVEEVNRSVVHRSVAGW
jgi:hypothetical protein